MKGLQKKAACPFNVVIFAKRDPLSAEVCGMLPEWQLPSEFRPGYKPHTNTGTDQLSCLENLKGFFTFYHYSIYCLTYILLSTTR